MALHGDPEVIRVFKMLDPKPKALVSPGRRLLREGEVLQYNTKERRPKLKYFFLFTDVLLITKREGPKKFWLKVYITLQPSLKIADVPDSAYRVPNVEFRLFAPRRTFIFFCKNQQSKDDWIRSIQACIDGKPSQAAGGHSPSAAASPGLRYDPSTGHRHSPQQTHPRPGGASSAAAGRPVAQEPNYEELYFAEKARQVMDTPDIERTAPESKLLRLAAGIDDTSSSRSGKKVAIVGADGPSDGDDDADFGSLRVDNSQPAPAFDLLWGDPAPAPAPAATPISSSPSAAPAFDLFGGTPSAPAAQFQFPAAGSAAPGAMQFPAAGGVAPGALQFPMPGQYQFPSPASGVPAPGQFQFPGAAPVGSVPAPGQFQFPGAAAVAPAPGQFQFPGAAVAPPAPGQFQFPGAAAPAPGQYQFPGAMAAAPGQYQFPGAGVAAAMPGQYQFPQATAAAVPAFGAAPVGGGMSMAPSKPRTQASETAARDPFADLVSLKL